MNDNLSKRKLREFGFLIGFLFPILLGWVIPSLFGHPFRSWTLFIGTPGLLLGIFSPGLLFYPYKLWMKIGYILGWFNSRIILGLVFILVLIPIALIMKILKYDPLRIKKNHNVTYREDTKNKLINLNKIF